MPSLRCAICRHPSSAEIDSAARVAGSSLGGKLAIAQEHGVTVSAIEKHVEKCKPRRARGGPKKAGSGPVEEAPPDSGRRDVVVEAEREAADEPEGPKAPILPPARELDTADVELRRRATLLTRHLEREDLEPRQVAQVSNALASIDRLTLARERGERPIHEHADFAGLVEDLIDAVVAALGPRAPDGIEADIAAGLEERQAARASGPVPVRRAA